MLFFKYLGLTVFSERTENEKLKKKKCLTLLNFAAETGFVIKQSEANRRMKWCTLSVFSKTVICYTRFAEVIDLPTLESLPDAFYCRAKDLCKLYASSSFLFSCFVIL